jgi:dTDP-4-amino-4,6-dideoxygalactose transaminase
MYIDGYNEQRRQNAAVYHSLLSDTVRCPVEKEGAYHVYHQYTIMDKKRDKIQEKLRDERVSSVVYYPMPLHLQEALRFLGYHRGDFPVAERAAREVLSLPMYPELEEPVIAKIAKIIKQVV